MTPTETIWPLDGHTLGKHLVLRAYLSSWLPIMGFNSERIVIIDGFAGPGIYTGGEPGSPMIALDLTRTHTALSRIGDVVMVFVEQDPRRFASLEHQVSLRQPSLPPEIKIATGKGTFSDAIAGLKKRVEGTSLAPSFSMIDPFGVKGVRHDEIAWLLSQPKSELYVSFMIPWVARFSATPEFEQHIDSFLGPIAWRQVIGMEFNAAIKELQLLFDQSLRLAGAKHAVRFDLYNGSVYKYSIFFASKHDLGCAKMKEAIWKAMPNGSYSYRQSSGAQLAFDMHAIGLDMLDEELILQLSDGAWHSPNEMSKHLSSDQTRFHPGQLKQSLVRLERAGRIEVKDGTRNRRGSFPAGTLLRAKLQNP